MPATRPRTGTALLALAVTASLLIPPAAAQAVDTLGGIPGGVLQREPQVTPEGLVGSGLDSLQFGDPTEQVDLIQPPEVNNRGEAGVTHPISVPPGRAGVEPALELVYDSSAGNSWVGQGWDLSVGAIEVDTRWGVPRYLASEESETYALDGEVLAPTAVRTTFLPRQAERVFTRRVEGAFERIVRHGAKPSEYWWEVTDKAGTHRYYGGLPESGRDPASILATNAGVGFRWGLTQVRDISGNTMTITYQTADGRGVGEDGGPVGRALYPRTITYTGIVSPYPKGDPLWAPDDPAYTVTFLRDSDLGDPRRPDVEVDARGGFLQVVHDRLRRIEVEHRGTLARAYELTYRVGAFGKSQLASVGRAGSDGVVYATHEFTYLDEVRKPDGSYDGFTSDGTWTSPDDQIEAVADFGPPIRASALGGGQNLGGYGRVYIGFNPFVPGKTGSFGGGVAFSGGDSWGRVELIDINGDDLPDKVFEKEGKVYYRLNESGAGSTKKSFAGGTAPEAKGQLKALSRDSSFSFSFGVEAYPLISVMYHHALAWAYGQAYFEDVNTDGMIDYVDNGTVYFNKSTATEVRFEPGSGGTPVPIDTAAVDPTLAPDLSAQAEEMRKQAPLQDTVRRWVAPWKGTISIDAPVRLLEPEDVEVGRLRDGVRVAIQRNGTELWGKKIAPSDFAPVVPSGVTSVQVDKGDRIYFRLQSLDDGTADRVAWAPTISYVGTSTALDVNGLDAYGYDAAKDFTLAGLPGARATATIDGTLRIGGSFEKFRRTSDDVTLQVLKNEIVEKTLKIGSEETGSFPVTMDLDVTRPSEGVEGDSIGLRVLTSSPIDLDAIDWRPTASFPNEPGGATMQVPVDYAMFSATDRSTPQTFWESTVDRTVDVSADLEFANGAAKQVEAQDGFVYVTIKKRRTDPEVSDPLGLPVFHQVREVKDGKVVSTTGDTTLDLDRDVEYWVDLSISEPALGKDWTSGTVTFTYEEQRDGKTVEEKITPTQGRHWAEVTGDVFPMPYRGWGYAGYATGGTGETGLAAKAIDESRLVLKTSSYPTSAPTGPNPPGYQNPVQGEAYVFTPSLVADQKTGVLVEQWVGPKASIWGLAGGQTSSRVGPDSVAPPGTTPAAGTRAVTRLSFSNSDAVAASAVIIGGSGAWAFSEGLQDFADMNGDGFPDNLGSSGIQYSRPRGGLEPTSRNVFAGSPLSLEHASASTFDLGGSVAQVSFNPKGDSGNAQGASTSGGKGGGKGGGKKSGKGSFKLSKTADASYGVSLGLGGSLGKSSSGADDDAPAATVLEKQLADMNGDGLPDLVRTYKKGRMTVQLNLGYSFASEITWAGGGLERGSSTSSSIGPVGGFTTPFVEFSGGVSRTQAVQSTQRTWVDLNGDGLVDQLEDTPAGAAPTVRFGTGGGLTDAVTWSGFRSGEIARSTANGLGGGLDFTLSFGPLCVAACYLIVNPGGGVEGGMSRQELELADVNGDAYPDHVASTTDGAMEVSLNNTGRTGLLERVVNPLGGGFTIGYERSGNTPANPSSRWVMSSVDVFDGVKDSASGAPRDPDQRTRYSYADGVLDVLEREFLGYSRVSVAELDPTASDRTLRTWERTYGRGTVFDSGLLRSQTLYDEGGAPLRTTEWAYDFAEVDVAKFPGDSGTVDPAAMDPVVRLGRSAAPRLTSTRDIWHGPAGLADRQKQTTTTMRYDALGNVVEIYDDGEPGDTTDDQRVTMTYTDCRADSWVNQADSLTLSQPQSGEVLRERSGDIPCDTGVPVTLTEQIGDGEEAVTDLGFNEWGSYNHIAYPANEDGDRYEVFYLFDADRHSDVAKVWDSHDLPPADVAAWPTARAPGEATYEPLTGRMASATDANGNTTTYDYDPQGRLESVVGPYEAAIGQTGVEYDYALDLPFPHATASHYDVEHPTDRIRTAQFVDGLGRIRQTQQDASVRSQGDVAAMDVLVVGAAADFDALGRVAATYYPTTADLGDFGTYVGDRSAHRTTSTYRATDEVLEVVEPGDRRTQLDYGFAVGPDALNLLTVTTTDPLGKKSRSFVDVHDTLRATELVGASVPSRTTYTYDAVGQLVLVLDPVGNRTTHTYDRLGRLLDTTTPDGGLVERRYDAASNLTSYVTPTMRAAGEQVQYDYDVDRLVAIDNPGGDLSDVSYTYGSAADPGNVARRVSTIDDRARTTQVTYDPLGQVASETTTMKVHNLSPQTAPDLTWTTSFVFDGLGRTRAVLYPDGERVEYGFDSGGLPTTAVGVKGSFTYPYVEDTQYDEFLTRRHQAFGNGSETETSYLPDTRRIATIRTTSGPDAREILDQRYTYDAVGNVKTIENDLPSARANLIGAPSSQRFDYDDFYRLTEAHGEYRGTKRRTYDLELTYDDSGNIATKKQTDLLFQNSRSAGRAQSPNTYDLTMGYAGTGHSLVSSGTRAWSRDANGNATGWTDPTTNESRTITFDALDRVARIADRSSTTDYTYDDAGLLRIERGPQGEVSTVNQYYAVRGGNVEWKEVWLGDQRIAIKRQDDDGLEETTQYFLHTDAGGSPTMVTGYDGTVFQNLEYLPTGEVWVHDHSTIHRQPYRFHGAYYDEYRNVYAMGQRWYEPREQRFLSPDPVLTEEPSRLLEDPTLAWGYAYGANNALRLSDPDGRAPGDNQAHAQGARPGVVTPTAPRPKPLPKPPVKAPQTTTASSTAAQTGAPSAATGASASSATTGVAAPSAPSTGGGASTGGPSGGGGASAGGGASGGGAPSGATAAPQAPSGGTPPPSTSAANQAAATPASPSRGSKARETIKSIITNSATPFSLAVYTGKNAAKPNKVRLFGVTTNRILSLGRSVTSSRSGSKP